MKSVIALTAAASSVAAVSPVQKVVQLLGELKGKVVVGCHIPSTLDPHSPRDGV